MALMVLLLSATLFACGKDDKKETDEVVMRVNNGYVQWRVGSDSEWTNLISLGDLSGEDGQAGQNGTDGIGIQSITINTVDELVITYTNGNSTNLGSVLGEDGTNGTDGISIINVQVNEEGHLIITLSNEETIDAGLVVGRDGQDGEDGQDGTDGREIELRINEGFIEWRLGSETDWAQLVSLEDISGEDGANGTDGLGIDSITINTDNELIITYTSGNSINLGEVVGEDGQDGTNGTDGISISSIQVNEEGHLIITLSNEETIDAGLVVGRDGQDGEDGQDGTDGREIELRINEGFIEWRLGSETDWAQLVSLEDISGEDGANGTDGLGIDSITINTDNELIITYTSGNSINLGEVVGEDGQDGTNGTDGISISSIQVNEEGHLIITLSNEETIDAGLVVGRDGQDGEDGQDGTDGREIELRVNEGFIEWRYVGEQEWTSLMELEELKGEDGHSAYELYKSHFPSYLGTEEEWLNDLINGNLGLIENFEVTLDLDGGVLPEGSESVITADKFETIQLPLPTRFGYEFLGWYTGDSILDGKFIPVIPVVQDFTLYAKWEEIPLQGVNIDQEDFDLVIGNSMQLTFNTDPVEVLTPEVIWTSSDANMISVDAQGKITAHQKGTVTITLSTREGSFIDTIEVTAVDATNPDLINILPTPELQIIEAEETFKWQIQVFDQYIYKLEIDHTLTDLPEFSLYASALNPYGSVEAQALFEDAGLTVSYDDITQTWTIDFGQDVTNALILAEEVSFYLVIEDETCNQWGSMYDVTEDNTFTYSFITLEDYALSQVVGASTYDEMKEALITYQDVFGFSEDTMTKFNDLPADQGRQQAIIQAMLLANENEIFEINEHVQVLFEFVVFKEYTKHLFIRSVDAAANAEEMVEAFETYVPTLNEIRQLLISQGLTDLVGTNYTTALYDLNEFIVAENEYVLNYVANHVLDVRQVTHDGHFYSDILITDAIREALDSDYTLPVFMEVTPIVDNLVIVEDSFVWTIQAYDEFLYQLEIDHSLTNLPEFSVYASEENPYGSLEAKALFEEAGVIVTFDQETQTWTIDFGVEMTQAFTSAKKVSFYLVIEDESGNTWGSMSPVSFDNTFTYSFISIEDYAMEQLAAANTYETQKNVLLTYQNVFGFSAETMTMFNDLPEDQGRHQAILDAMLVSNPSLEDTTDVKELFEFVVDKEYTKHLFIRAVDAAENTDEMVVAFETYVPTLNEIRQFLISQGLIDLVGTNYTTALFELNEFLDAENEYVVNFIAKRVLEARSTYNNGQYYGVVAITDEIRNALDSDYTLPEFVGVSPSVDELVIIEDSFVWTVTANDENLYKLEIDHSLANLPEFSVYASVENPYGSVEAKALFEAQGVIVTYNEETHTWTIDFGDTITDAFITAKEASFYLVIEDVNGNKWGSMFDVNEENTFTYSFITIEDYTFGLIQETQTAEALMEVITTSYDVIGISQETMDNYYLLPEQNRSNIDNIMFTALEIGQFTSLTRVNTMFTFLVNDEVANQTN
jgi:uncharacterized repeat protein (TIGR02543 family)